MSQTPQDDALNKRIAELERQIAALVQQLQQLKDRQAATDSSLHGRLIKKER